MIKKVVIPAAGLGTRLLPVTKEMPKEMLPIFVKNKKGETFLKPILQVIFEDLFDFGFSEFCFVVGRGKRAIEDHFTSDHGFVEFLRKRGKDDLTEGLEQFYNKLDSSTVIFVNQPQPRGFGDAIHKARSFTGMESFLVHAGDDLIASNNNDHLKRLLDADKKYNGHATFLVEEVKDPTKYGVIVGDEVNKGIYKVKEVIEKPSKPPSNLAIIAIYLFKPIIYDAIQNIKPDENLELQLTDAIQNLAMQNHNIYAVKLEKDEKRLDIGTADAYKNIIQASPRDI
ncbi:MAG: sugar phosphate nucleotidyltransferase [Candidatus Bathyarchaeota archaeon]|nr:sugar phosphate nucleotidyltransferase [Candidatus Bathyarchaeota archaeon]